jgi:vitamin B12 transporter
VEAGGYSTWRTQAAVRGAAGPFDYSLAAAHLDTNNREPNSAFSNTTLSAALGYQLSGRTVLRGVVRAELGRAGTPGQTAFGRPDMDAYFERDDIAAGLTFLQDVSPTLRHRATYGVSVARQDSVNLELDAPYTPHYEGRAAPFEFFDFAFHSRNDLRRHYATYQADWTLSSTAGGRGAHLLTGAVDWDGERGTVEDVLASGSTEVSRDNVGLTVQHQASWSRVFATAGLRLERNESFGTAAAPRASIVVIGRRATGPFGETRLKSSAGRGVKEPTALQTFSSSPFFLGNPDLEPEEARTVDVGIEQRLAADRLRLEATWFDNAFTNIIAPRTISFSPFVSQYFNIGRTKARGLEVAATAAPSNGWLARAGYTWLDSEVVESRTPDDPVFGIGRPLFRRPRHSAFGDISASRGPVSVSLSGIIVGRRADSDFSSLQPAITEARAYSRWDVRASYRLRRGLALTFAADNVTGADYMDPLGYPALGRTARVGVRTGF